MAYEFTPDQKSAAESMLAGPATCPDDVDVCGMKTAVADRFGAGTFDGAAIKRLGVSLKWDVDKGIETMSAASNVCVAGTWVAGGVPE